MAATTANKDTITQLQPSDVELSIVAVTEQTSEAIGRECDEVSIVNVDPPFSSPTPNNNNNNNNGTIAEISTDKTAAADATAEPKFTIRTFILLTEIVILCVAVMFIEMCVVPALPTIQTEYQDQASWIPWMLSAYNIVGAIWAPLSGKVADLVGAKWVLIFNMGIYAIGQIGCALFKTIFGLIASRACQGAGMSIFVLAFSIIAVEVPSKMVATATAIIGSLFSVGMSIGLVGGAALCEKLHWQKVFWITFPFIVLPAIALAFTMYNDFSAARKRYQASASPKMRAAPWYLKFDILGTIFLASGIVILLMGLTFADSESWNGKAIAMVVIGGCLLVALCIWDFFFANPLIPIKLLLSRKFGIMAINTLVCGFLNFTVFQMDPYLYTSPLMDYKFTKMLSVGLVLLPFGLSILGAAVPLALLAKVAGWSILYTAMSAVCLLFFGLQIECHHTIVQAIIMNIGVGVGLGGCNVIIQNLIIAWATKEQNGTLTGTTMLLRVLGGAIGPVLINIFLHNGQVELAPGVLTPSAKAYKNSFIFMTCVAIIMMVVIFLPDQFQFVTYIKNKIKGTPAAVDEESQKKIELEEKKKKEEAEKANDKPKEPKSCQDKVEPSS